MIIERHCEHCESKINIWQKEKVDLERHVQVSKNFGLLGGWLRVVFYTFVGGDPTGLTETTIEYP